MSQMEKLELDAHRSEITFDVKKLVEKYRAIFGWDIPDIDHNVGDKLILKAIHESLCQIEDDILGGTQKAD